MPSTKSYRMPDHPVQKARAERFVADTDDIQVIKPEERGKAAKKPVKGKKGA